MPIVHSDRHSHFNILESYATVLDRQTRAKLLSSGVRALALAQDGLQCCVGSLVFRQFACPQFVSQDARQDFELVKCRAITGDYETVHFLLDLGDTGGSKEVDF